MCEHLDGESLRLGRGLGAEVGEDGLGAPSAYEGDQMWVGTGAEEGGGAT